MKQIPSIIIVGACALFSSLNFSVAPEISDHVDFSVNPPAARTGAPNVGTSDELTCTFCHSGSILSAVGTVDLVFNPGGLTTGYSAGETYPMEISVTSGSKSGFQLTVLNGNLQKAGEFVNGPNTSTITAGGREYIRHSASTGVTTFSFDWVAPISDMGNVMAFYTFNKANNNGTTSGDLIYKGSSTIFSNETSSITSFEENPSEVKTFWDASAKQIHVDYSLKEESRIVVNVQTLQGQLVQTTTIGEQAAGEYHHVLDGREVPSGIYIISVFVNNHIFNQKTLFN